MGLEDREYLKNEGYGSSFGYSPGGSGQSVCKLLIMINVAVFLLQIFSNGFVEDWFAMQTDSVLSGQIWRLLTYGFCHSPTELFHILFNMLFLWWFGPRLESIYGSREFVVFYLTSIIVAGLAYAGIDLVTGNPTRMLGASGGVMAVVTLYACHFPRQIIYLFFVIPIELRWLVGLLAIIDLHPLLLELKNRGTANNVAHAAHLGGMAFGFLYWKKSLRLDGFLSGLTKWWKVKKSGFKVVGAEPDPKPDRRTQKLEADVDSILDKINREGEASLTRSERKTLEKASRELRNRRG